MSDQPEPTTEPASAERDKVTWVDIMLWTVRPASECTFENPAYTDFVRRFKASQFSEKMECPAGGHTLEQIVLGSMARRDAQAEDVREFAPGATPTANNSPKD